jgi:N-acetyl-gamma-glutamylphosphate reductase
VSGYSGAGTTPSPRNDPERLRDSLMPYSLIGHTHEKEISRHLGHEVRFMPHVAGFFRGISLTVAARLTVGYALQPLWTRFIEHYEGGAPLIRLSKEVPELRDAVGKHTVQIGGFTVDESGRNLVMVATLDNLLKGAATQCLQNLNLALGLDELAGIPL